jgi:hypothetical protein
LGAVDNGWCNRRAFDVRPVIDVPSLRCRSSAEVPSTQSPSDVDWASMRSALNSSRMRLLQENRAFCCVPRGRRQSARRRGGEPPVPRPLHTYAVRVCGFDSTYEPTYVCELTRLPVEDARFDAASARRSTCGTSRGHSTPCRRRRACRPSASTTCGTRARLCSWRRASARACGWRRLDTLRCRRPCTPTATSSRRSRRLRRLRWMRSWVVADRWCVS